MIIYLRAVLISLMYSDLCYIVSQHCIHEKCVLNIFHKEKCLGFPIVKLRMLFNITRYITGNNSYVKINHSCKIKLILQCCVIVKISLRKLPSQNYVAIEFI